MQIWIVSQAKESYRVRVVSSSDGYKYTENLIEVNNTCDTCNIFYYKIGKKIFEYVANANSFLLPWLCASEHLHRNFINL